MKIFLRTESRNGKGWKISEKRKKVDKKEKEIVQEIVGGTVVILSKLYFCYCCFKSTIGVTGLREGGDVRGNSLPVIMILKLCYKMHTYLRYA